MDDRQPALRAPRPALSPPSPSCPGGPLPHARALLGLALLGGAVACDSPSALEHEGERSWGEARRAERAAARAEQALDAGALDTDPALASRVLGLGFAEAFARLGSLRYQATIEVTAKQGGPQLVIFERTTIDAAEDGSYRMRQQDKKERPLRELVYAGGQLYVKNGAGALRRRELGDAAHQHLREQGFEGLSVFTRRFGPRLGLEKQAKRSVGGRPAVAYKLLLKPGEATITVDGRKLQPKALSGSLAVDQATGVVLQAKLKGRLRRLPEKTGGPKTTFTFNLDYALTPQAVPPIQAEDWIPEIHRLPVDLNPLRFLKGGTRTSTVIGGQR